MAVAIRQISNQSGSASPGGGIAGAQCVSVRSLLTITPSASAHSAAGSTTSAYSAVSAPVKASCTTTNSARCRPAITDARFDTDATGLVQIIHAARISPSAIRRYMSMVPLPASARIVPCSSPQRSSTNERSAGFRADRWPGRPGPMYPISRPPIAFGWPVSENGPRPGGRSPRSRGEGCTARWCSRSRGWTG